MESICEHSSCTACGACAGVCPKNCISFRLDKTESGHIYPIIDQNMCINCGLCKRTCPANNPRKLNGPKRTYAAYVLDEKICNTSSSGGLSYAIGKEIIRRGGIVYGSVVEYGDTFCIGHKRIDCISDLSMTQGSKYVYSRIDNSIYHAIKTDLIAGRDVLFTGTGCQIAGVRNYLKRDYPNFYAIDIICHGVPSLKLLVDYLSLRYDVSQIRELRFRSKSEFKIYGIYGVCGVKINLPLHKNLYMMGFMKGLYYRTACYDCRYAQSERTGDITLGDFWGLKGKFTDRPGSSRGTSVVLVNTSNGISLIESIQSGLGLMSRPLSEAIDGNSQLRHPSGKHLLYSFFKKFYPILGFRYTAILSLIREKIFYSSVLPLINRIRQYSSD